MNLASSSFKLFLARVCKSGIGFLAVVIFSRSLGASPLGTYYPFLALVGIVSLPADFGISHAAQKRISEGKDPSSYLGTALTIQTPILLTVGVIALSLSKYINEFLGEELTFLFVLTLIFSTLGDFSLGVIRSELRVGETAALEIVRPLSWLVVGYLLFVEGFGVKALVYGYLIGSLLTTIVGWWKVSTSIGRPTVAHAKSLLDYSRFSVVSSLGGYFYSWSDVTILTLFAVAGMGVMRSEIGAYENAWRLSLVVMLPGKAIATTLFPQISRWDTENALSKVESSIPSALLPSLLLVIPAFGGIAVLSQELLTILFGPEFVVAWLALIILTGGKITAAVHAIFSQVINAIDRPDLAAYAAVASVAINIVLNAVLIWFLGITGAAVATVLSFTANTLLHAYFLRGFIEIRLPFKEMAWSAVATLIMGISVHVVRLLIDVDSMSRLLFVVIFGAVVYASVVLLYSPIQTQVRRIAKPLLSNLTGE